MSVQVSYKKQTIFGIMGLLVIFLVVEGIANVWWITQITCEFENNNLKNVELETKEDIENELMKEDLLKIIHLLS